MKQPTMKLEIKEPCHEDWEKMKLGMTSRFCDSCEKSVMDFTTMNRAQIITYLLSNPNDKTCGRMTRDQFDFHHTDIPILIQELKRQKHPNPFLILALVSLSLASCAQEQTGITDPDPIEVTMGMVAVDDTLTSQCITPDSLNVPVKGNIAVEPIEMQGEVEMVEMGDIAIEQIGGAPDPLTISGERVRQFSEKMPEFKGGIAGLESYFQRNLHYPAYEKKQGIQGTAYVRFVVDVNGQLSHPEIVQSVPGSRNMDREVLRLIQEMPNWIPGSNQGKPVPVYMNLPIRFQLQ